VVRWSAKHGEFPAGDPEIHHIAGTLFAQGMDIACCEEETYIETTQMETLSTQKDTSPLAPRTHR